MPLLSPQEYASLMPDAYERVQQGLEQGDKNNAAMEAEANRADFNAQAKLAAQDPSLANDPVARLAVQFPHQMPNAAALKQSIAASADLKYKQDRQTAFQKEITDSFADDSGRATLQVYRRYPEYAPKIEHTGANADPMVRRASAVDLFWLANSLREAHKNPNDTAAREVRDKNLSRVLTSMRNSGDQMIIAQADIVEESSKQDPIFFAHALDRGISALIPPKEHEDLINAYYAPEKNEAMIREKQSRARSLNTSAEFTDAKTQTLSPYPNIGSNAADVSRKETEANATLSGKISGASAKFEAVLSKLPAPPDGIVGQTAAWLRKMSGEQTLVDDLLEEARGVQTSLASMNLNAGSASDADMRLALEPLPDKFTNPDTMRRFYRGATLWVNFIGQRGSARQEFIERFGVGPLKTDEDFEDIFGEPTVILKGTSLAGFQKIVDKQGETWLSTRKSASATEDQINSLVRKGQQP